MRVDIISCNLIVDYDYLQIMIIYVIIITTSRLSIMAVMILYELQCEWLIKFTPPPPLMMHAESNTVYENHISIVICAAQK
jgi:hypothetical protein